MQVESESYSYADGIFYQPRQGGGYIVVVPPVGAEVNSVPTEALREEDGDVVLHQFDQTFFSEDKNDSGQTIYRVEPQPPEEEIDEIPAGSTSFVADGETYYYVNYSLYVEFEESGRTGFVNGMPDIGAQLDELPEGVTTIEEEGVSYYQFDTVFFEEVEDESGGVFYEVVGSPDGEDTELTDE